MHDTAISAPLTLALVKFVRLWLLASLMNPRNLTLYVSLIHSTASKRLFTVER